MVRRVRKGGREGRGTYLGLLAAATSSFARKADVFRLKTVVSRQEQGLGGAYLFPFPRLVFAALSMATLEPSSSCFFLPFVFFLCSGLAWVDTVDIVLLRPFRAGEVVAAGALADERVVGMVVVDAREPS